MPELLAQHHVDVEVDFFGFCLQDADDTAVPVPYPEGRAGTGFVSVLAGRIDVESAGHTHLNDDDAAATMGWAVVYRFTDNGITASDPLVERPALLRLLRTLRARGTSEGFSVCGVIAVRRSASPA
ncbi:hypothetical protein [Streptomyces exfoliatus]|uniref:hypothetical protein n=1 Tax=Streptomyces exfoliatus TaxID=1905 RepID=UPI003C2E8D4C